MWWACRLEGAIDDYIIDDYVIDDYVIDDYVIGDYIIDDYVIGDYVIDDYVIGDYVIDYYVSIRTPKWCVEMMLRCLFRHRFRKAFYLV